MAKPNLLETIEQLNIWNRGGERAPHKPLLLLLYLGHLSRGQLELSFEECAQALEELLREFGPTRRRYHPEYPFWFLQQDGLWKVSSAKPLTKRKGNSNPSKTELISKRSTGTMPEAYRVALARDSGLFARAVSSLLTGHFPQTLHADILEAVGLASQQIGEGKTLRDPTFRPRVLTAYEYRCSVCAIDLRIRNVTVGLEAAHIKWRQAGGPDIESNGLALCVLHHKLFDLGAFTIHKGGLVLVSEHANGTQGFQEALLQFHGRLIVKPSRPSFGPGHDFLHWHRKQVFKAEPRHLPGTSDDTTI